MTAGCSPSLRKLGGQTDSPLIVKPPVGPPDLPAASPNHTVSTQIYYIVPSAEIT